MLVLSRKAGEGVVIGNDIHVRLVEIRGNKARLAFDAPDGIEIVRDELITLELGDGVPAPEQAVA